MHFLQGGFHKKIIIAISMSMAIQDSLLNSYNPVWKEYSDEAKQK